MEYDDRLERKSKRVRRRNFVAKHNRHRINVIVVNLTISVRQNIPFIMNLLRWKVIRML